MEAALIKQLPALIMQSSVFLEEDNSKSSLDERDTLKLH